MTEHDPNTKTPEGTVSSPTVFGPDAQADTTATRPTAGHDVHLSVVPRHLTLVTGDSIPCGLDPASDKTDASRSRLGASTAGHDEHMGFVVPRHPDPPTTTERRSAAKVDAWRAAHPNTPVPSDRCLQCHGGLGSYACPGFCMHCCEQRRQAPKEAREAFLRDLREHRDLVAQFEAATTLPSFVTMLDEHWKVTP